MTKILGGATLLMAIALGLMWRQNSNLNSALGAAELSIEQARITNEENIGTINLLRTNLGVCIDQRIVDERQNELVVIELRRDIDALESREQEVRIIREEIFRDPTCADFGSIDIGGVCPSLGISLLDRANDINQD